MPDMLVFIDESGDPGFKLSKGSSQTFAITMVIFHSAEDALLTTKLIFALQSELRIKPEFKFSKLSSRNKDIFFTRISACNFSTRTIIVQKSLIYSDHLRTVKDDFYRFFVRQMLENDAGILKSAKVVIDGSGDRHFKNQLRSYMRKNISSDSISRIDLKDSVRDPLIQLADMCVGAISRSYKSERINPNRWKEQLRRNGQIGNVWEFK